MGEEDQEEELPIKREKIYEMRKAKKEDEDSDNDD